MLNVVIINGGRGAASVISSLLERQGLHVTSVVNAFDDGKSTGEIRRTFGMLGPSDIRKVQELMLPKDNPEFNSISELFKYRFPANILREEALKSIDRFASGESESLCGLTFNSAKVRFYLQTFAREFLIGLEVVEVLGVIKFEFNDCSLMNCIYAGAFLKFNRNLECATKFIDRLFRLRGTVLPASIEDKHLVAIRENGEMLYSEAEIVELRSSVRIERIYLLDRPLDRNIFERLTLRNKKIFLAHHQSYVSLAPSVKYALQNADLIIYAAGTQHSSLYPTYLSNGFAQTIAENKVALKVFLSNIGADYETPMYTASDYLKGAFRYLNLADSKSYLMSDLFTVILVNRNLVCDDAGGRYVKVDEENLKLLSLDCIIEDFESAVGSGKHDGDKVCRLILDLYESSIN